VINITDHGVFFLSHIHHPIPVFVAMTLFFGGHGDTQCDIKKLSHEWYHIDIKD
jgi:hypothetical protein